VVALGLAVALTAIVLDQAVVGRLSLFFDVSFVLLCVTMALAVRPTDFFTVGVLPPLVMVAVFTLVGLSSPDLIADPGDGLIQAVVSGLSHHAGALVTGYLLCLICLAVRHRVVGSTSLDAQAPVTSNRDGSPAPTRNTSG
jgi:hypothetical protein